MARATQSQLKKLKKLMTEKMSLEKAYSSVMMHCEQSKAGLGHEHTRSARAARGHPLPTDTARDSREQAAHSRL